jgi:hypothetical protein
VHALDAHTGKQLWATALPDLIDSSAAVIARAVARNPSGALAHAPRGVLHPARRTRGYSARPAPTALRADCQLPVLSTKRT